MNALQDILGSFSNLRNIKTDRGVEQTLLAHWQELFGQLSDQLHCQIVRKGKLTIGAANPMWVTEIEYYKDDLLKRIQTLVGAKTIKSIHIQYAPKETPTTPAEPKTLKNPGKTLEEKIRYRNRQLAELKKPPA